MTTDRRRAERYPATLRVGLRRRGGLDLLETLDVSRHGAFIRTAEPRQTRELLQLTFELPDGEPIETMCMVSRVLPDGMGVEFFSLSKEAKTAWDAFVQNCRILASVAPSAPPVVLGTALPPPGARRKHVRLAACFLVRLQDEDALREFFTRDISQGGCFIPTPVDRAEGDEVEVILVHPTTDEEFHLPGMVTRAVTDGPEAERGLAIRFAERSAEEQAELAAFIETGLRELRPAASTQADHLATLTTAVEEEPTSWEAHFALGSHLLDETPGVLLAVRALHRALELHPACAEAHRKLHRAYVRLRDPKRAGEHLRVAIALEHVQWDEVSETTGVKTA